MKSQSEQDPLWDPYDAFEQMLRQQFGTSPEQAIEQINRELAANPETAHFRLELRPAVRARARGFRLTPRVRDR